MGMIELITMCDIIFIQKYEGYTSKGNVRFTCNNGERIGDIKAF